MVPESLCQLSTYVPLRAMVIKAFNSRALSVRWEVHGRYGNYCGAVNRREAIACLRDNILSIYVRGDCLQSPRTLMELAGDICDMFHISSQRQLLVHYVITQDDKKEIEEILDNHKIPQLPTPDKFLDGVYHWHKVLHR